jgi:hypothetical protein
LFALFFLPAAAGAQDRTASALGFGGLSMNSFASPQIDFGADVTKELTPNIHVVGEFGHLGDMLPSLSAGLALFSPYDVRVSAYYVEGGVRLLAAPGSGVNPYVDATAGVARLTPKVSGLGGLDAIAAAGFNLFSSTDPILGVGGGVLLRGGPVVVDLGYRYKQVTESASIAGLLSVGDNLRAHQVRLGIGVRF